MITPLCLPTTVGAAHCTHDPGRKEKMGRREPEIIICTSYFHFTLLHLKVGGGSNNKDDNGDGDDE